MADDWTHQAVAPGSLGALATGRLLPRPDPNAPPLPPGEPRRPLGKDPVSDFVEFLKGIAVSNDADSSTAQHSGALLGAALPFAAPAIKLGRAALGAGEEATSALKGIRAFHGSPHDFDRFDLTKIGTGEGNQSYGHGLYFAGNEQVARGYRQNLSTPTVEIGGQPHPVPTWSGNLSPEERVVRQLGDLQAKYPDLTNREIVARVRSELQNNMAEARRVRAHSPTAPEYLARIEQQLAYLDAAEARGVRTTPGGKMYEVNLDVDPAHLLDWDRGLHEQSPHVAERLRDVVTTTPQATGAQAYHRAAGAYGSPAAASDALRVSEIPGIRYLDRSSRDLPDPAQIRQQIAYLEDQRAAFLRNTDLTQPWAQEILQERDAALAHINALAAQRPTYNYAIFDPRRIAILRKYGLLPPLAAGALGSSRALDALRQPAPDQIGTPPPTPGR